MAGDGEGRPGPGTGTGATGSGAGRGRGRGRGAERDGAEVAKEAAARRQRPVDFRPCPCRADPSADLGPSGSRAEP